MGDTLLTYFSVTNMRNEFDPHLIQCRFVINDEKLIKNFFFSFIFSFLSFFFFSSSLSPCFLTKLFKSIFFPLFDVTVKGGNTKKCDILLLCDCFVSWLLTINSFYISTSYCVVMPRVYIVA